MKDLSSERDHGMIDFQISGVQSTVYHRLLPEASKTRTVRALH